MKNELELSLTASARRHATATPSTRPPETRRPAQEGLPEEVQALAPIFRAELQAYQGKYQDAARAFAKAGEPQKAIDLFAVLTQCLFPMASTRCHVAAPPSSWSSESLRVA